jgi:hypothetical protein
MTQEAEPLEGSLMETVASTPWWLEEVATSEAPQDKVWKALALVPTVLGVSAVFVATAILHFRGYL